MSAGNSPCTISTNVTSTLALVCSTDVTSLEVDGVMNRACAVRWQRLSSSGRYSNVTSSSTGKYSVWRTESSASNSDYEDSSGAVNVLQIAAVQRDDLARFVRVVLIVTHFHQQLSTLNNESENISGLHRAAVLNEFKFSIPRVSFE